MFKRLMTYTYKLIREKSLDNKQILKWEETKQERILNLLRAKEIMEYTHPHYVEARNDECITDVINKSKNKVKLTAIIFDDENVYVKESIGELIGEEIK